MYSVLNTELSKIAQNVIQRHLVYLSAPYSIRSYLQCDRTVYNTKHIAQYVARYSIRFYFVYGSF